MKEENNTEGLYTLKIDARHYFPDGKTTWDVLEALRCRKYAEVLAFYLECDLDDIEKQVEQEVQLVSRLVEMRGFEPRFVLLHATPSTCLFGD